VAGASHSPAVAAAPAASPPPVAGAASDVVSSCKGGGGRNGMVEKFQLSNVVVGLVCCTDAALNPVASRYGVLRFADLQACLLACCSDRLVSVA
jgi:hypothetical protein